MSQHGSSRSPAIPTFGVRGQSPPRASPEADGLAAPLLGSQQHAAQQPRQRVSFQKSSPDEPWPDEGIPDDDDMSLMQPVAMLHKTTQQQQLAPQENDGGMLRALVFGGINALVGLPALIAFATIVFQVGVRFHLYIGADKVQYSISLACCFPSIFVVIAVQSS